MHVITLQPFNTDAGAVGPGVHLDLDPLPEDSQNNLIRAGYVRRCTDEELFDIFRKRGNGKKK